MKKIFQFIKDGVAIASPNEVPDKFQDVIVTAEYQHETIYFCCRCKKLWQRVKYGKDCPQCKRSTSSYWGISNENVLTEDMDKMTLVFSKCHLEVESLTMTGLENSKRLASYEVSILVEEDEVGHLDSVNGWIPNPKFREYNKTNPSCAFNRALLAKLCPEIDAPRNKGLQSLMSNDVSISKPYPIKQINQLEAEYRHKYSDMAIDLVLALPNNAKSLIDFIKKMDEVGLTPVMKDTLQYLLLHQVITADQKYLEGPAIECPDEYAVFLLKWATVYSAPMCRWIFEHGGNVEKIILDECSSNPVLQKKATKLAFEQLVDEGISYETLRTLADTAPKKRKEG